MLTAQDKELDKLVGLFVRADDCLTKPWSPVSLARRSGQCRRSPFALP